MQATATLPLGDRLPDDHPPPHHGPIEGPGVWYGADLARQDDWRVRLTETERQELLDATAASAGHRIKSIARDNFTLPTLGPKLDALRREVIAGRGFVVVQGMPIETLDFESIARMYWGFGTYFGAARSQNTRGHLLGHVTDIEAVFENKSDRGYLSSRHLPYHCDSVDMVALFCLRTAKQGGLSSIVSSYTIHNELWRRWPELARALYGPIARDRRDEIPNGKGPWYELPVFNYFDGRLSINFLRKHIDTSQRHADARRMSDEVIAGLDKVSELANDPALHLSMAFEPGDIQLLHNHQILHDRTAYEDWPEPERRRYLLRLWLSPPDGIALPSAFAGRYRSTTIGDRGGVEIPGMETNIPLTAM
ncbi:MAG: TauD/TfdA family dioxygenase [Pseudomonadota bacterium]